MSTLIILSHFCVYWLLTQSVVSPSDPYFRIFFPYMGEPNPILWIPSAHYTPMNMKFRRMNSSSSPPSPTHTWAPPSGVGCRKQCDRYQIPGFWWQNWKSSKEGKLFFLRQVSSVLTVGTNGAPPPPLPPPHPAK